jgi:zinc transport system substrate-binding protein
MKRIFTLYLLLILIPLLVSCRQQKETVKPTGKLQVVCTIFPLYDFTRNIAGDKADVSILLPPGIEPHHFEPKPDDIVKIGKAGLFIYTNKAMEPWAEDIIKGVNRPSLLVVDASSGLTLRPVAGNGDGDKHGEHSSSLDPHVWLDFANAGQMCANILAALVRIDPANAAYYKTNCETYQRRLGKLDNSYRQGLAECRTRTILHGGHNTFGYLAARYGITYIAATDISADAEPTPARMAALVKTVRELGVSTIFSEELVSPRLAETLATESGAKVALLNGAHNLSRSDISRNVDFITIMEENLRTLRTGLKCR